MASPADDDFANTAGKRKLAWRLQRFLGHEVCIAALKDLEIATKPCVPDHVAGALVVMA